MDKHTLKTKLVEWAIPTLVILTIGLFLSPSVGCPQWFQSLAFVLTVPITLLFVISSVCLLGTLLLFSFLPRSPMEPKRGEFSTSTNRVSEFINRGMVLFLSLLVIQSGHPILGYTLGISLLINSACTTGIRYFKRQWLSGNDR